MHSYSASARYACTSLVKGISIKQGKRVNPPATSGMSYATYRAMRTLVLRFACVLLLTGGAAQPGWDAGTPNLR